MLRRQACPQRLLTVHTGNNNQSLCHGVSRKSRFCWELRARPRSSKQWLSEGPDSFGMALRNHEIDKHLSMTPVNQRDKSSVSLSAGCYSAGDRHSPRMQTLSPICQRHNNVPGRPHLHHLAHNKCNWWKYWLLYHGKEDCPSWPFSGKSHFYIYLLWPSTKHLLEMRTTRMLYQLIPRK